MTRGPTALFPDRAEDAGPGWARRSLEAARRPAHAATSAHLQAAYPFLVGGQALGGAGCYIGTDHYGASFCYDPFELYGRRPRVLTSPNMLVMGMLGAGKSALVKSYLYRQVGVFGRRAWVLDVTGEWAAVAAALGATPLRLQPGGSTCLNPIDPSLSETVRLTLLESACKAALGRALHVEESAAVREALRCLEHGRPREVTLPDVAALLLDPLADMAERLHTDVASLAAASREAALAIDGLCSGVLAGMFDGPTTPGLHLNGRCVVLDLSAMRDSAELQLLMACALVALRAALARVADEGQILFVIEEAWRLFKLFGSLDWLPENFKFSRRTGLSNIAICHRPSDMSAAGDEGSRDARLAEGILADADTRVIYRLAPEELSAYAKPLGMSETEARIVGTLGHGEALWMVGGQSFLVYHRLSRFELGLIDTDAAMLARAGRPSE